jgi:hypothetical protein
MHFIRHTTYNIGKLLGPSTTKACIKTLLFAVFDGWNGEPHPAEEAYSCIQDFATMARLASDRVLALISRKGEKNNLIDLVPPKEFQTVTRTF